jgi:hypothetical protein
MQNVIANLSANPGANVDHAAEALRIVGNQSFGQWFGPPQFMMGPMGPVAVPRPDVWLLLVGYTGNAQPKIITAASAPPFNFAPNLSTTGFAAAGVVPLAVYLLNRLYKRGLSVDIAKGLAAYCIIETASQDGKVGGPLKMAVARADADIVVIDDNEIADIGKRAGRHRETLRNSFLNPVNSAQQGSGQ